MCSGVTDVGAYYPHRVTYHPTCHSLRMLRVGDKPLSLLRAVEGIDLVELPQADVCCGFGGTFALKNADTSSAMLADKIGNVLSTGAEVCSAGDSSCLMHIGGGLSRQRSGTAPCIWPDPGVHQGEPGMSTATFLGRPAATRTADPDGVAAARRRSPSRRPRARSWQRPTPRATSRTPPPPSGPNGPWSSTKCPTGRRCGTPGPRSRPT